ncbi:MAG: hypothetical protein KC496_05755, partial [Anaerolineae bacterium]|nr:hypothetical protein [Anaerolineae bacterium]
EASPATAKEIINLETGEIFVGGGDNEMPDDVWLSHNFRLPILQNSTRNLMFDETCFFRSPNADEDCSGTDECFTTQEIDGYSWYLLTYNMGQDCFPDASGCHEDVVEPGYVSITTIDKCQQVTFSGSEIYVLSDGQGNRFVMHANASGTPDLNPDLPVGWTLEAVQIDEPLVLLPFGGDHCYYNIVRDNLVQAYHQFEYAGDVYPLDNQ